MRNNSIIFSKYSDYLVYQTECAYSLESEIPKYREGQEEYIKEKFSDFDRKTAILDCACGDGIGLRCFGSLNFTNVVGIELSQEKAELAKKFGFKVFVEDMHKLLVSFNLNSFDVIYSSHTLEHALDPDKVLWNFHEILRPFGFLLVVLPYPDNIKNEHRSKAHCGSQFLGLDIEDQGQTTVKFFLERGFALKSQEFRARREPETWLKFKWI